MARNGEDQPYYRTHVFCCTNERQSGHARGCCADKGAARLRAHLKARVKLGGLSGVRVNIAGCLDRCELGAVMVIYPDNIWYTYRSKADIDEIFREHLVGGRVVERLKLTPQQTELDEAKHWAVEAEQDAEKDTIAGE